jgi:hypothetical protein
MIHFAFCGIKFAIEPISSIYPTARLMHRSSYEEIANCGCNCGVGGSFRVVVPQRITAQRLSFRRGSAYFAEMLDSDGMLSLIYDAGGNNRLGKVSQ